MNASALECRGLNKSFGGIHAIRDLDLTVADGRILALVGPSGCGKTTLLRLIAGFELPDFGTVILRDKVVADGTRCLPPEHRGVGMVFQDYALFPHFNVYGNVSFGLRDMPEAQRRERVDELLALVGLDGFGDRWPNELSGGERRRVALARALAPEPVIILLDEPFSNLDADRRTQMREEVRAILKRVGATAVLVTHDQEEALYFGDELAVLHRGNIEQIGSPEQIFHAPVSRTVAEFMGQTDFLPGRITNGGIHTELGLIEQEMDLPDGTEVELAVRADDVQIEDKERGTGWVLERHFKGALNLYRLQLPTGRVLHSLQPHTRVIHPGTHVEISLKPGHPLACFHQGNPVRIPVDRSTLRSRI